MPSGSVLFSSRAPIGYVAIASQPVTTNQGFKSFVLPDEIDPSYAYYYLQTASELVESLSGGTTFKEISGANAARIRFAIAPIPEQRRIVAKIEKQFTRLDAAVAALRRTQANLKRYRASILRAACSGELVPAEAELARAEGREYEPASVLLQRILPERRAHWEAQEKRRGKYKEPATPDTSDLPALPEGWAWATVDQVIVRSEYGTSVKCNYESDGLPVLRIPNIVAGEVDLADLKFANQTLPIDSDRALQVGDVLMCRTNGSISLIGKTAVVKTPLEPYHSFASYLLRFRFTDYPPLSNWFHTFATSQHGRNYIEREAASSAGQHNVSLSLIHRMPVPLPPLAEQHRIVAEVDRRLSVTQHAEAAVEASMQRGGTAAPEHPQAGLLWRAGAPGPGRRACVGPAGTHPCPARVRAGGGQSNEETAGATAAKIREVQLRPRDCRVAALLAMTGCLNNGVATLRSK